MRCSALLALLASSFLGLTAAAQAPTEEAKAHLQRNAFRYGLTAADLADLVVTDTYASRRSGTTHVYLRQRAGGIEIAEANFTVALDRGGRVFHSAGRGAAGLTARGLAEAPALGAEAAAAALARDAGLRPTAPFRVTASEGVGPPRLRLSEGGVAQEPLRARLVYHLDAADRLHLAWEVGLYERDRPHYWLGYVDARTGQVLERADLVVHDRFGPPGPAQQAAAEGETLPRMGPLPEAPPVAPLADAPLAGAPLAGAPLADGLYRVYAPPAESPSHASPAPPADGRALVAARPDPLASPLGWHSQTDGVEPEFTATRGNNVHAYPDRSDNNRPDGDGAPDGGPGLVFDFPLDLAQDPRLFAPAAATNVFFWSNAVHDLLWHYGFDEPAGNFQQKNYGRGGEGGDALRAEVHDGGGLNNANFATLNDGTAPRMQMYLWDYGGPLRDSAFDNGIILHEYAHGLSNRLVGGPATINCLRTFQVLEQMGEGWSDHLSVLLTMRPGDTRATPRGVGTFVLGQPPSGSGTREYPYAADLGVNPLTYGDTRTMTAPHRVGTVWATILWEVTWDLIEARGFDPDFYRADGTAGNQVMLNLVVEGMKLAPCEPGFVDARDAILAADQALYDGRHTDLLWAAFARRGLGVGAEQGSSLVNTDNAAEFTVPEAIPPAPITDLAAAPAPLGAAVSWTATGDDGPAGTAKRYDVRYSADGPILTDAAFAAARRVEDAPRPRPGGAEEHLVILDLGFAARYHFSVRAIDDSGNPSGLSNPASTTTLAAPAAVVPRAPIAATAPSGGHATAELSVGNDGPSDLLYAVVFDDPPQEGGSLAGPLALPGRDRGAPGALQRGGPDAFGYTWIGSDDLGGPRPGFVDISGTGAGIAFEDYGARLRLPFAFPFYGAPHRDVTVWENGFLQFGPPSPFFFIFHNRPIPDPNPPNNLVVPFWDDFDYERGGKVYHQDLGDGRFVVQWTEVEQSGPEGPPTGRYTFQVVLHESGKILFEYEEMEGDLESATVGVEAAGASDGLGIVHNGPGIRSDFAVRILAPWASADPQEGRLASGTAEPVVLRFDAVGLAPGQYAAEMRVATNDPAAPAVAIPLSLTVTPPGAAAATNPDPSGLDAAGLDFAGPYLFVGPSPNPFGAAGRTARLTLAVAEAQDVQVGVYDLLGRRVALLHDGALPARAPEAFVLDGAPLTSGTYVVRITGETFAATRRVTLLR